MEDKQSGAMMTLVRWCIGHRRRVVVAWLAVAILATAAAGSPTQPSVASDSLAGCSSV